MRTDLKINYGGLEALSVQLSDYSRMMEDIEGELEDLKGVLEEQKSEAVSELSGISFLLHTLWRIRETQYSS